MLPYLSKHTPCIHLYVHKSQCYRIFRNICTHTLCCYRNRIYVLAEEHFDYRVQSCWWVERRDSGEFILRYEDGKEDEFLTVDDKLHCRMTCLGRSKPEIWSKKPSILKVCLFIYYYKTNSRDYYMFFFHCFLIILMQHYSSTRFRLNLSSHVVLYGLFRLKLDCTKWNIVNRHSLNFL